MNGKARILERGAQPGNCASAQHEKGADGSTNYRENTRPWLGGSGPIRGFDMRLNHFSRRVLASTAAAGDGQAHLDFEQRPRALIDSFADLSVADGMAQANVHGLALDTGDWRQSRRLAIM
jgi:hypothetical protein